MAITIMETGTPPASILARCGQTADWFMTALAEIGKRADIIRPYNGETLPEPTSITATIITGSWSLVTYREDWSENLAAWIRKAMSFDIPLFGVCYGHQLMAHALGGIVGDNPSGGEQGMIDISLTQEGKRNLLLDNFPDTFRACLFHQQSVIKPPSDCDILAISDRDGCQMLRYGTSAFSVQFHPEFTPEIMASACGSIGLTDDPEQYRTGSDANWPRKMLHTFCRIAEDIG